MSPSSWYRRRTFTRAKSEPGWRARGEGAAIEPLLPAHRCIQLYSCAVHRFFCLISWLEVIVPGLGELMCSPFCEPKIPLFPGRLRLVIFAGFFSFCVSLAFFGEKFRVRIAAEQRFPIGWTHSIPALALVLVAPEFTTELPYRRPCASIPVLSPANSASGCCTLVAKDDPAWACEPWRMMDQHGWHWFYLPHRVF